MGLVGFGRAKIADCRCSRVFPRSRTLAAEQTVLGSVAVLLGSLLFPRSGWLVTHLSWTIPAGLARLG
jgi:hypothetical protein